MLKCYIHIIDRVHIKANYETVVDSNPSSINPNNLVLMVYIKMLASVSAHELTICEIIFGECNHHASKHFYDHTETLHIVKASLDKEIRSTNGKRLSINIKYSSLNNI